MKRKKRDKVILLLFLILDNYGITIMKNITDDSTADNLTCLMKIHILNASPELLYEIYV